jgi:hypothetical protein
MVKHFQPPPHHRRNHTVSGFRNINGKPHFFSRVEPYEVKVEEKPFFLQHPEIKRVHFDNAHNRQISSMQVADCCVIL